MCQTCPFALTSVEVLCCMSEKRNHKNIFKEMHFIIFSGFASVLAALLRLNDSNLLRAMTVYIEYTE